MLRRFFSPRTRSGNRRGGFNPHRHSGMRLLGRRPGIHNPESWLWIPGSRLKEARPGMQGFGWGALSSRLYLALQRRHLELILVVADGAGDEARGDRRAVIMQDRYQPHRV